MGWTGAFGTAAVLVGATAGHPLHLLALVGPLLWVPTLAWSRPSGVAWPTATLARIGDGRGIDSRWLLAAVVLGVAPTAIGATVSSLLGSSALSLRVDGAGVVAGTAAFALLAGFAEEPGWRGVALAGVDQTSWRRRALVVAVLWSLWHLPLYGIPGTHQHDIGFGTVAFGLEMVTRVPLGVLLAALVVGSGGRVVLAVVAHAVGNLTMELLPEGHTVAVVELIVLAVVAAVALRSPPRVDAAGDLTSRCTGRPARRG